MRFRRWFATGQVVLVVTVTACSDDIIERQRISNLQKSLDAVVAIKETGATVATPTEVFITPAGTAVTGNPVFLADKVEDLRVDWRNESTVVIHAKSARVFTHVTVVNGNSDHPPTKVELDIQHSY